MLAAIPIRHAPRSDRRGRIPLRICAPSDPQTGTPGVAVSTSRDSGQPRPIGELLPQVLARYLPLESPRPENGGRLPPR